MALLALGLLSILGTVNAELAPTYPVNAQLPPVARVSEPFEFVFSQGTFAGSGPNTQYSLVNAPSWLELDSKSRTISGTPQKDDIGSPTFDLVAADETGSVNMEVNLVVTTDDGPKLGKSLLPQLEALGATSAPDTLVVHSGDSFSLTFDHDTFTNTRPSTVYYGTSPDNAPLPSWVSFDQAALRFSGSTPDFGPQTFSFNLIASDVAGFSAATVTFAMTVSPHILSFNKSAQTLFLTKGKYFESSEFLVDLTLDGHGATGSDLTDIHVDFPKWLALNKETISLSGTPPADAADQNVTITVTDKFEDVATLLIGLQFSQFFHDDLDECDAVIGQYFSFVFNSSILTDDSVSLDVDLGDQLPWLHYNRDNKTIYGQVPSDLRPGSFNVNLTAREETAEDSRQFTIKAVSEKSSAEDAAGTGTADEGSSSGGASMSSRKAGIIAVSVILPLIVLSSLAILLFFCWRRKRKGIAPGPEEGRTDEKTMSPRLDPDSDMYPHCQPFEQTTPGKPPRMMRSPSPSSKPPKLEIFWHTKPLADAGAGATDTDDKENAYPNSTLDWDFGPLASTPPEEPKPVADPPPQPKRLSFQSSPPVRRRTTTTTPKKREPLRPIQPRRSLKRNSTVSRSRRYSKRSSGISTVASGLPVRLSGAGHGAGGFGPPGHGVVRISWQNTQASFQSDESDVGNLAPLFPRPPLRARESTEYPKRVSLRAVEPDTLTISDTDSLEAFVHSRAKSRNSSNPLFAGQFGRRGSSGGRALHRARSTVSRADTVASSHYVDDYRQDRPWSAAMSASIYTDDHRQSAYLHSLSEESSDLPLSGSTMNKQPSQSSLAQNYSEAIAPLPRFYSELSLSSAQRGEASNHHHHHQTTYPGGPPPSNNERPSHANNNRTWFQVASNAPGEAPKTDPPPLPPFRKSPSLSSMPFEVRSRRVSLIRPVDRDWSEQRGIQRELTGSVRSDIAFV
ncbi:putative transmembrane glycoprotein [Aspergillus saccharolyticus JOP 1030-1]|uniref:Dystroglycan-type cadherin-like domain-containing protein n=1 Tax=Aspergillus saccharolyticus JOP 1030-1 TaxID=1450539 RepID=A0A318ZK46_9EURO|nr:hypothetical protein BP01DRAFT_207652 [Aspergillus saccharolyticus JOP 1030-1]PYH40628.1 hypothetical protein BP01DRAFT_207652 [Aspergillus saccharolyticus JOP 1030-1]